MDLVLPVIPNIYLFCFCFEIKLLVHYLFCFISVGRWRYIRTKCAVVVWRERPL